MKNPFRKNNREFSGKIFKQASQQKASIGSEHKKEYLTDGNGYNILVRDEFAGLEKDENGLPIIMSEKIGILLDCSHRVYSLDGISGRCKNNCLICLKCNLYTCQECGEKVCDKCLIKVDNDKVICKDHIYSLALKKAGAGLYSTIKGTIQGLFGISVYES